MATIDQKEISKALAKFYSNPIAGVSLELIFSLFAILFFAVLAIRPTLQTISGLITEINEKKELDQQLQRKIVALSTAQDEYQRLSSKINLLDQTIPSKPELIKTIKVIEKHATENNVVITSIRIPEIPEETSQMTANQTPERIDLYFSIRVTGDYPSIRDFLGALNQYRRMIVVEEIGFIVDDLVTTQQLNANLSVRTPYFGKKQNEK